MKRFSRGCRKKNSKCQEMFCFSWPAAAVFRWRNTAVKSWSQTVSCVNAPCDRPLVVEHCHISDFSWSPVCTEAVQWFVMITELFPKFQMSRCWLATRCNISVQTRIRAAALKSTKCLISVNFRHFCCHVTSWSAFPQWHQALCLCFTCDGVQTDGALSATTVRWCWRKLVLSVFNLVFGQRHTESVTSRYHSEEVAQVRTSWRIFFPQPIRDWEPVPFNNQLRCFIQEIWTKQSRVQVCFKLCVGSCCGL